MFTCTFNKKILKRLPVGLVIDQYYQICKEIVGMTEFHGFSEDHDDIMDRDQALSDIFTCLYNDHNWELKKIDELAKDMMALAKKDLGINEKRIHFDLLDNFNDSKRSHLRIVK